MGRAGSLRGHWIVRPFSGDKSGSFLFAIVTTASEQASYAPSICTFLTSCSLTGSTVGKQSCRERASERANKRRKRGRPLAAKKQSRFRSRDGNWVIQISFRSCVADGLRHIWCQIIVVQENEFALNKPTTSLKNIPNSRPDLDVTTAPPTCFDRNPLVAPSLSIPKQELPHPH